MWSLALPLALLLQLTNYALQLQQDPQCHNLTLLASGGISGSSSGDSGSEPLCKEMRCDPNDVAKLEMDNLSYVGGESQVTVTIDPNATDDGLSSFYYVLCSYYSSYFHNENLIGCGTSNYSYSVPYTWPILGPATVQAEIRYGNGTMFSCANRTAVIAYDGNLNVGVCIEQGVPSTPIKHKRPCNQSSQYMVGNISFIPFPNMTSTNNITTYKYDFGDQTGIVTTTGQYITHEYKADGYYEVTVDAFILFEFFDLYYHAQFQSTIVVLEVVKNVSIEVSKDNSVQVGSTKNITISAMGSTPISVCWCVLNLTSAATPACISPDRTCVYIEDSTLPVRTALHEMNFNQTGKFSFLAVFQNNVSTVNGSFNFTVYPAPSPPVVPVASGASAVVALAVLTAVVVVIIIVIVGFVLPYRKYKRRMTETANFRFVDLTESGSHHWEKFKSKIGSVASNFKRRNPDDMKANFNEFTPLNGSRHKYSHDEDL